MAQATYKNLTKDYRNMNLMQAVGIALSSWREGFGANEYGEFDDNDDSADMVPLTALNMVPPVAFNMVPPVALEMVPA